MGRTRALAVLTCMTLAVAMSRCSGNGSSKGENKGQAGTKTGAVKEDGELVVGQTKPIPQIDPHAINAAVQQQLLSVLWNGLTKWGPGDSPQPDLAFKVKVGLGVRGDVARVALARELAGAHTFLGVDGMRELRSAGFPVIAEEPVFGRDLVRLTDRPGLGVTLRDVLRSFR